MEYITLNNGIKMPMVGFGVFQIQDAKTTQEVVEAAIKTGYRLIDTAQAYGNEEAVGKAIKSALVSLVKNSLSLPSYGYLTCRIKVQKKPSKNHYLS